MKRIIATHSLATGLAPLLGVACLAWLALCAPPAFSHGSATARHGGVAQMANDLGFELVATPTGATIYIEDHGKPLPATGMSGKLTVLDGANKSEAPLSPAGNTLVAPGIKLPKGAKAVAAITTANQKVITVRFTVR
jgi:hypothetical protein